MIYFLLPSVQNSIVSNIECIENENCPEPKISYSLSYYLSDIKNKIQKYGGEWDIFKKYTNPYEYINSYVPNKNRSVSKQKPLSRSYYKMIEIINTFNLNIGVNGNNFLTSKENMTINSFHLAEGPGGFIEALAYIRDNPKDTYTGMTILDEENKEYGIPAWKKSDLFLKRNPNVLIETGIDKTGNILSNNNFNYCISKYGSSMDIITADGGFDFSTDFNSQEINITKLLFGQVCYALCMQKKGGHFILKVFDCFMEQTIDILYILSCFYEKVYLTKPLTSRYANSEKYVVCKNFLTSSYKSHYIVLKKAFCKMLLVEKNYIHRFLNIPVSNYFISKLEEYNSIIGQQQIENIYQTIILLENKYKNDKIDNIVKTNIQKCVHWCIKYEIPYNNFIFNEKMCFL